MADEEPAFELGGEGATRPYEAFFHMLFRDREVGDFPFRLTVEATDHCNLGCPACPREDLGRPHGFMDPDLFLELAAQVRGREVLFYPQGFGEAFMHPRFFDLLGQLEALGVHYPVIITNATFLDEEVCTQLVECSPVCVVLSVDGSDPDLYEKLRPGADYEEVVENCKRLFDVRERLGATRPHIVLSVVDAEGVEESMAEFRAMWEPLLRPTDEIFVCSPITWAGAIPYSGAPGTQRREEGPRQPCRMLYKTLSIYHDGRATPCCYDSRCELEVGNARTQSIEEIWRGEKAERLRRLHEEGRFSEIPLCRDCPDWFP